MRRPVIAMFLLVALAACSKDDDGAATPCERACARAAAEGCPNEPSASDCAAECEAGVEGLPVCQDEMNDLISCFADGPWACDASGQAEPLASCDAEYDVLLGCGMVGSVPLGAR